MTITRKQQQAAADVLLNYTLPDCLKPQYDGMTAYEIAGKMVNAALEAEEAPAPKEELCPNCEKNAVAQGYPFCAECLEREAAEIDRQKEDGNETYHE